MAIINAIAANIGPSFSENLFKDSFIVLKIKGQPEG